MLDDGLKPFERAKMRAGVYKYDPTDRIARYSLDEPPTQAKRSL